MNKQHILDQLQKQLTIEQEREATSEKSLEENPSDITRSHYHTDSGTVNGLLLAMDIVKGVK